MTMFDKIHFELNSFVSAYYGVMVLTLLLVAGTRIVLMINQNMKMVEKAYEDILRKGFSISNLVRLALIVKSSNSSLKKFYMRILILVIRLRYQMMKWKKLLKKNPQAKALYERLMEESAQKEGVFPQEHSFDFANIFELLRKSPPVPPGSGGGGEESINEKKKDNDLKAQSPLSQFAIVPFIPMKIGTLYLSFTNASFFLLFSLISFLFLVSLVTKKGVGKLVSNAFQSVLELLYDFVLNLVNEQIGGLSGNVKQEFFPCILVTLIFLLFCNLQGMIPYSFTVTSHFLVTLGLSFSLFIGITIVGFAKNGLHFLSFLLPAGVPLPLAPFLVLLELISYSFRALSLGIRLFANMMAGHSLVKILSGFAWTMLCMNDIFYFIGSTVPFFIVLALTGLELGVAILQAYVFTILMCIYLNDAINLH